MREFSALEPAGEFNNPKGICSASLALDCERQRDSDPLACLEHVEWQLSLGLRTHLCRDASLLQSREIRVAPVATRPGRHVAQVLIKAASGTKRERERMKMNYKQSLIALRCSLEVVEFVVQELAYVPW